MWPSRSTPTSCCKTESPSSTCKHRRHLREELNISSLGTAESHNASFPTNRAGLGAQIQHWGVVKLPHCFPEAVAPKQNNFSVMVVFSFFEDLCAVWVRGMLGDPGCRNESSSEGHTRKHLIVLPSQSHRYKPASVSPPQPLLNVFTRAPLSVPFCYYKA